MNNNNMLTRKVARAEQALNANSWDEAERLYNEVLQEQRDNYKAAHGLNKIRQLREIDSQIQEKIQQGDEALKDGKFREAFNAYTSALDLGGQNGILKYHRLLEEKRNQARDLDAWQKRMGDVQLLLKKAMDAGEWDSASEQIGSLLKEMPNGELYEPMRQNLEQGLQYIEARMGDAKRYERARALLKQQDFEGCIRLAKGISRGSKFYGKVKRLIDDAQWAMERIEPRLEEVQNLYEEGRWEDALAALDKLRAEYPESPVWHDLWLRVTIDYGREELNKGREAEAQERFIEAQGYFEKAECVSKKTLEVYETHKGALRLRDEACDLARIVALEEQAKRSESKDERDRALKALEEALRILGLAKEDGREYVTVEAKIRAMRDTLKGELERIREEARQLKNGERLLQEKRLEEARQEFSKTLDALIEEHLQQAVEGLSKVEEEIRAFEAEMERGRHASDVSEAVQAYQEAYKIWPSGPQVRKALEESLVAAGRAARKAGRKKEAAEYFTQAKNFGVRVASLELGRMEIEPRLTAELEEVRGEMEQLRGNSESRAVDFEALERRLRKLAQEAEPYEELRRAVENLSEELATCRKEWGAYERQMKEAREHYEAGRWPQAVEALRQGLNELGDYAPSDAWQLLREWEKVTQTVKDAEERGRRAIEEAQVAYESAAKNGDYTRPVELVERALAIIGESEKTSQDRISEALRRLRDKAQDLQRRAEIAEKAYTEPSAANGLLVVQQGVKKWPEDGTLRGLEKILKQQAQGEIESLIRRADEELASGELTEALDLLRQARELDPNNSEVGKKYVTLRLRRDLEDQLRSLESDYLSKQASGSIVEAGKVLRGALELLLSPEYGLEEKARSLLQELLEIGKGKEGLAFGEEEGWREAQEKVSELGRLRKDWLTNKAAHLVDLWTKIARDVALKGVVSSETKLGNLIEAYEAARTYMQAHPEDKEAVEQEASVRRKILERLSRSIVKRLGRAKELLEQGDVQLALQNLNDIREEFYQEVQKRFPNLLKGDEDIAKLQAEEEELRHKVKRLQDIYDRNEPHLEQAQTFFDENKLEEAEQELRALGNVQELPYLNKRAEELREKVKQARLKRAIKRVHQAITMAQTGMETETTIEGLEKVLEQLKETQQEVDLQILPPEDRSSYKEVLAQVSKRIESLNAGSKFERLAEEFIRDGKYEQAAKMLERAIELTRDKVRAATLEVRLDEINEELAVRKRQEELWEEGESLFREERYDEARRVLIDAETSGVPKEKIATLLSLSRIGELVVDAERGWEEDKNPELTKEMLEDARGELGIVDRAGFEEDVKRIERRIRRLERKVEKYQSDREQSHRVESEIRVHLVRSETALAHENIDVAMKEMEAALAMRPDHEDALALQKKIQLHIKAKKMMAEAQELMFKGDYDGASARVEAILSSVLPDYPEAVALKGKLEKGREASKILVRAETAARNEEFQQAREALREAADSNADHERLRKVQKLVEDLEREWESRTLFPIRDAFHEEQYAEALDLCRQALQRVASPNVQTTLENWKTKIVSRWVESSLDKTRRQLSRSKEKDLGVSELEGLLVELDRLRVLDPPQYLQRELETLKNDILERKLRLRLAESRRLLERREWGQAINVAEEVKKLAGQASLAGIRFDAVNLIMDIEDQREEVERLRNKEQRDKLLQEASERWQTVKERHELEHVRSLTKQVLKIEGYEEDREARELLVRAEEAIRLFDETKMILEESWQYVRQRQFQDAERIIGELKEVSSCWKDRYEKQRKIVQVLRQAERNQEGRNWDAALKGYQEVIELEQGLSPLLENDLERCRQKLMDEVISRVQMLLMASPPQVAMAERALDEAKERGWLTPLFSSAVTKMRRWIESLKLSQKAEQILEQGGKVAEAVPVLQQARSELPMGIEDETISQLEDLTQVMSAWEKGDLKGMQRALRVIEDTRFNEWESVRQLRAKLRDALAEQEQKEREAARRREEIERASKIVKESLRSLEPQYERVAKVIENVAREIGDVSEVQMLREQVKERMVEELEMAREKEQYAKAIELASLLPRLLPGDKSFRELRKELIEERQGALNGVLNDVRSALRVYRLEEAEGLLERAETIAQPDGDGRIASLRHELEERKAQIIQVNELLKEAQRTNQWELATEKLRKAQRVAGEYERVKEAVADLQRRLRDESEKAMHFNRFGVALNLCDLGLKLGRDTDLEKLHQSLLDEYERHIASIKLKVRKMLEVWDIGKAQALVLDSLEAIPEDRDLLELRKQVSEMEGKKEYLRSRMEKGWASLRERDLKRAKEVFEEVSRRVPEFREGKVWLEYVTNFEQAIQVVEGEDVDRYPSMLKWLDRAWEAIRVHSEEELPKLWDDIEERRRQAVWDVYQMRKIGAQIAQRCLEYDEYYMRGEITSAFEVSEKIDLEIEELLGVYHKQTIPPANFQASLSPAQAASEVIAEPPEVKKHTVPERVKPEPTSGGSRQKFAPGTEETELPPRVKAEPEEKIQSTLGASHQPSVEEEESVPQTSSGWESFSEPEQVEHEPEEEDLPLPTWESPTVEPDGDEPGEEDGAGGEEVSGNGAGEDEDEVPFVWSSDIDLYSYDKKE